MNSRLVGRVLLYMGAATLAAGALGMFLTYELGIAGMAMGTIFGFALGAMAMGLALGAK